MTSTSTSTGGEASDEHEEHENGEFSPLAKSALAG